MTRLDAPKRSAPGAKLLITTTALAATLGGWAALARQQPDVPAAPPSVAQQVASAPQRQIELAPIPTLVPLAGAPEIALGQAPTIRQPAQTVADAPPAPAAAAPAAAPALRAVSAPPAAAAAPVARTRSSR